MQNTLDYDRIDWGWLTAPVWCLGGIATGILFGGVIGWIDSWVDFVFLKFLVIYIVVVAGSGWVLINSVLIKARLWSGILSLTAAVLIMFGFLAGYEIAGYFQFRQMANQELHTMATNAQMDTTGVDFEAAIDRLMIKNTGLPGFAGFLVMRVETTPTDIFLRMIAGMAIAIFAWRSFRKKPYCKECGHFYGGGKMTGVVLIQEFGDFKKLVEAGNFLAAGQILRQDVSEFPKVVVYLQSCLEPRYHESTLTADFFSFAKGSGKLMTRNLMKTKIKGSQWENFNSGMKAGRPQAAL